MIHYRDGKRIIYVYVNSELAGYIKCVIFKNQYHYAYTPRFTKIRGEMFTSIAACKKHLERQHATEVEVKPAAVSLAPKSNVPPPPLPQAVNPKHQPKNTAA
jgi:hypothetical protein